MEIDNVINIIQAINKIDLNDEKDIELNNNNDGINSESKDIKDDIGNNSSNDEMRDKDSSLSQNSDYKIIDIDEDSDENVDNKIPNLFERLLMDKHNIKYQDIIKEVINKKNYKRSEIENDDDLSDNLLKETFNKIEKVKSIYPKD